MATTEVFYNGDGSDVTFTIPFEYLEESDVKVSVGGTLKTQDTDYTFSTLTEITFTTAPPSGTNNVRIFRDTDIDSGVRNEFFAGSAIRAQDLNDDFLQVLYSSQEIEDQYVTKTDGEFDTNVDMNDNRITEMADPVNAKDAVNKQYFEANSWDDETETIHSNETWNAVDSQIATTASIENRVTAKIDDAITNDIGTDGTGITVSDDGDGTITLGLADNTIDLDKIKNGDIINQAEQDASSPSPTDSNIFTALAAARRFDTLVQSGTPTGSTWETGKTWFQNDVDKTVYVWDGNSWEAITSGGAFTRLDQVIYVDATNGDDANNGHRISSPKKTIKAALSDINSDSTYGDGSTILVAPGVYKEAAPLDIKKKDVAIIGASVRNVIVHPTQATETNSLFRVNSGSYLQNMTFTGVKASGTRGDTGSLWTDSTYGLPPTQGWNVSFYPDAKIYKSPYIQNCTNFSDSEIDNDALNFYAGTEDKGRAGDQDSAPTGGGLLVDGSTVHDDSPLRSMVADSYTHVGLDGPGIFVTNNGYTQITSSYAFFNHFHIACLNGGQANLAASTSDFGRYSLIADGRSTSAIFTATTSATAADGATTFTIGAPTAGSDWHGSATRPQDNMLVDIGGNTYPVLSAVANGSGWDVTISRPDTSDRTQNLGLNGSVANGSSVSFFLRSMIASSGHTMEYVGSGTNYSALPENGGVPVDANQKVERNNGKVWSAITDHNGTFKVGDTFEVNQQTGFVNIPAGALSVSTLLANLDVNGKEIVTDSNNENIVLNPHGTGTVDVSSSRITSVTDPTGAQDAATKNYVDNFVNQTANIADDAVTTAKIADNAVTMAKLNSGALPTDITVASANLVNGTIATEDIADSAITSAKIADGTIVNGDISDGTITSAKLTAATVVTESEQSTATANDTSFFTTAAADARYFNISSGDTIKDGQAFPDNDTTIATTAAINDRIIDLVEEVGGFVPIANETSFPTANPDINNGTGTIVSIGVIGTSRTPSSGTVTITNGAGSGNTVTITGCGTTVLAAGFGCLVETTSTLHTYTFHRLTPKATEVTTVASNISDINTVASNIGDIQTLENNIGDIQTLENNITDIQTVADQISPTNNISTVAGISSNITTVAGISSDVTTVAGISSDVEAVADKATEIGRLGTADAVADMALLGTTDVVADMNTLATSDIVADMNTLATTANVANMDTCADDISNINTVAGSITNVNTTAGSISNVNTVASNISSVNDFAARYRVSADEPTTSLDDGDLWWDTTNDTLKVYDATSSSWVAGVTTTSGFATTSGFTMTGDIAMGGNSITGLDAPAADNDAARKVYVDDTIDSKIDTALTGDIVGGTGITVSDNTPNSGQITIDVTAGSIGPTQLASTTVTAGSYGSSSAIPTFTVDADGRLTAAGTASIDSTSISNGTSNVSIAASGGNITMDRAGSTKLTVTGAGIDVTGSVTCDGLTVDGAFTQSDGTGRLTVKDNNNTGNTVSCYVRGQDSAGTEVWKVGQSATNNSELMLWNNTNGAIRFATSDTTRAYLDADGHFIPATDDTYDLGLSNLQWRNAYFDGTVNCDGLDVEGGGSFDSEVYIDGTTTTTNRYLNFRDSGTSNYRATLRRDAWYLGDPVTGIGNVTPTGAHIVLKMNGDADFDGAVTIGSNLEVGGTGYVGIASGTTAQRPASPSAGYTRFNSTIGSLEFYDGTNWVATNLVPSISSVTGNIYAGTASQLTINATDNTNTVNVTFSEGGTDLATVTSIVMTGGSGTLTVPSAVYGQTAGDTITIRMSNSDGTASSNSTTKTVLSPPTGGSISTTGNYRVHTFTTSSSLVVPTGTSLSNVEYIVVAGGGCGASWGSGGGGGGGYRSSVVGESSGGGNSAESRLSLSAGTYTVTIGAGSAGNTTNSNGSNSVFDTITANGGGHGGGAYGGTPTWHNPGDGGCGGGSSWQYGGMDGVGGTGTSGQGYDGGDCNWANTGYHASAGGGGAGEEGQTPASANSPSGDGGDGVQSNIDGNNYYYAGGGGGGIHNYSGTQECGDGGLGGGGGGSGGDVAGVGGGSARNDGGDGSIATTSKDFGGNGGANTGGGGGGGESGEAQCGGNGGSGIVIVRYQLS